LKKVAQMGTSGIFFNEAVFAQKLLRGLADKIPSSGIIA
jgi:hypothetical protein